MRKSNSNTNNIVVHILICALLLLLPTLLKGETYTITWSVAGNTTLIAPTEIESRNILGDLPIPDSNCQDKVFYGWTTESYYAHETEPPTCIKETTIPNGSTTYYAVFAERTRKEKSTWDEIELNNINSTDSIAILMEVKSSNGSLFHYALTNVTDLDSDLAQATSVQNIEFTQRQVWSIHHNIDFTFCIQSRFNTEQWLDCTGSDVRVSNINTNRN